MKTETERSYRLAETETIYIFYEKRKRERKEKERKRKREKDRVSERGEDVGICGCAADFNFFSSLSK